MELLLGCGTAREKRIYGEQQAWSEMITLDINRDVEPDYVFDLNNHKLPFKSDHFDEIHAYDVLEHVGKQGDWRFFFKQFEDFWRVLKPEGRFYAICPKPESPWAWGDPGHTRVIARNALLFLDQTKYGEPPMTDYRGWYKGDFEIIHASDVNEHQHAFVLQAVKPARRHG